MLDHFLFPGVRVEPCQTQPHTLWLKGHPGAVQDALSQGVDAVRQMCQRNCEVVTDFSDAGERVIAVRVK